VRNVELLEDGFEGALDLVGAGLPGGGEGESCCGVELRRLEAAESA
jgi:hypothetical protein